MMIIISTKFVDSYLLALCQCIIIQSVEVRTTFFKELYIRQYQNFGSLQVIDFKVPDSCITLIWHLRALKSPSNCDDALVQVYQQYGSIPVAMYDGNLTFPNGFDLSRSYLSHRTVSSNGSVVSVQVSKPLAGTWFTAAFIEIRDSQTVKKVTSLSCSFGLQANVSAVFLTTVTDIAPGAKFKLHVKGLSNVYRFYVEKSVYKYIVTAVCNVDYCPIVVSARGGALPEVNQDGTLYVNSSSINSNSSSIIFWQPLVESWHYLNISVIGNFTIPVEISLEQFVCGNIKYQPVEKEAEEPPIIPGNFSRVINSSALNSSSQLNSSTPNFGDLLDGNVIRTLRSLKLSDFSESQAVLFPDFGRTKRDLTENNSSAPLSTDHPMPSSHVLTIYPVVGLQKVTDPDSVLYTIYSVQPGSSQSLLLAYSELPYLMNFEIDPVRDIGGTLRIKVDLAITQGAFSNNHSHTSLDVCIQKGSIPIENDGLLSCSAPIVVSYSNSSFQRLIPYPEPGPWFVGVQRTCYNGELRVNCTELSIIVLQVQLMPCVDGNCENGGQCKEYSKSIYTVAACSCIAGYRGYTCEDSSMAPSDTEQMAYTLLLCISNLFFIPAIILACYRRRYVEAIVYFANMFFSSFYHACDMSAWSRFGYCLVRYDVLSFCDFLCSILSFWVTLVAVARLPVELRSALHMTGAVLLAMAVRLNTHGLVTNITPIAIGVAIVIVSWIVQCCRQKKLFPSKKIYLCLLPGIGLAGVGMCIFAFVETDQNYPYTHSVWHMCMSLCIIFLLPKTKVHVREESSTDSSSYPLDDYNDATILVSADFTHPV